LSSIKELMDKGYKYFDDGKYNNALNVFLDVLDLETENVDALIQVGLCYRHLEQYHQAIEYYEKAIAIDPENSVAYNNIGYSYECQKDLDRAIEYYEKALEIDPSYDRAVVNLTNIFLKRKEYGNAVRIYKNALKKDPLNVANWIDLGRAYRFLEDYQESINAYQEALNLDPFSKIAWNNIGYAFYCMDEYNEAIEAYTKSLDIEWLYDLPFSNLIKVYKKLLRSEDNNPERWKKLAEGFLVGRAYNRATDAVNRALQFRDLYPEAEQLKEKILEKKKKIKFGKSLAKIIEDSMNMFSQISTSAKLSDVIDYIKHKFERTLFDDDEIKFKIFETIRDKGLWVRLDDDKFHFYNKPSGKSKVDYLK